MVRTQSRKPKAFQGIKPDPNHPMQDCAAQLANARAKAKPCGSERAKLNELPTHAISPAAMEAALRPLQPSPVVDKPKAPRLPRKVPAWLLRIERVICHGVSAAVIVAFVPLILREIWNLSPILWALTGETFARAAH